MPLYEYGCLECGAQFEKLVHPNHTDPICCPQCASTQIERMISLFSTSQGAPSRSGESGSHNTSPPNATMHKPHCGYDWAKPH